MAEPTPSRVIWPSRLSPRDDLYAVVNNETDNAEYLILASEEKGATFLRDNGAWFKIDQNFFDDIDDPKYGTEFVDVDFIPYYDVKQRESDIVPFYSASSFDVDESVLTPNAAIPAMTAAAGDCPPATMDISVNLKNRKRAIRSADYGPMNPGEENTDYWVNIANLWGVSVAEARKSTCGNCVFFYVTTEIRNCIAEGLSSTESVNDPWDSIDAGDLGYCEAFDFKCAAARTCAAWASGGPITDEKAKKGVRQ